ncbi:receptor-like protein 46 [Gossypium hirsutum]|uniref:Receptor-like protein 46 n=1 Tax=Gossypium hirsutum TaxID=3635 RepID=A0ABM3AZQ1_GOSHI|nr:receptor-like protein 46 [Gossypium hirsutum]
MATLSLLSKSYYIVFVLSLSFIGSFPRLDDQREALLEFKDLLFGELMTDNSTDMFLGGLEIWNSNSECCQWALVERNSQQVTGIGLKNLSELVYLDMRGNSFNGLIPLELFHLANLEFLDLSDNMIERVLPNDVVGLKSLKQLSLDANFIHGQLPEEIGNLIELKIPLSILQLRKLEVLNLQNNSFSLEIPADIGSLANLTTLDLSKNRLSGEVPLSIRNMLSGEFLTWFFDLNEMKKLHLGGNKLTWNNNLAIELKCSLPSQLFQSRNLSVLALSRNNFSGELSEINIASIMVLLLSENNFSGPLPKSISNTHRLLLLDLSKNSFSGNEFPAFGPDSLIAFVDVSSNTFSGKVPSDFRLFTHLDLHGNNISGEFPAFFSQMSSFQVLNLRKNSIKGSISNDLSSHSSLRILDLSNNYLNGEIPQSLGNLIGMIETPNAPLTLSEIFKFPVEIHDLIVNCKKAKQGLSIRNRDIYTFLDLSKNSFGDLESVETLDLSHNSLDGEIPGTFSKLLELNYLDLSNNKLGGKIPGGPQMDTLVDPNMYANNSGLCGVQIEVPCEKDLVLPGPPLRKKQEPMYSWIATGVRYPVGFLSSTAVMYVLGYFNTAPAYHRRGHRRSS